jgi:hypothetical protein
MANKPFEIQSSTLTIGGVDLQAGTTGVVIPGVTQAIDYFVEEVDERGDQTVTFQSAPILIDYVTYLDYENNGSSSGRAEYSVDEIDDDGYIEGINIDSQGAYTGSEAYNGGNDLFAYTGTDTMPGIFVSFVGADWTQIPFRPRMRAGEIENVGGGADLGDFSIDGSELSAEQMTIKTVDGDITIESDSDVFVDVSGGTKRWSFANNGNLTLPAGGDILDSTGNSVLGGGSSTHIEYTDEETEYTSTVDLTYNFEVDVDNAHLNINGDGTWAIGSNNFDTKIFVNTGGGPNPDNIVIKANDNDWTFDNNGNLTLPEGGDILDSTGNSVLGSGSLTVVAGDGSGGTTTVENVNEILFSGLVTDLNDGTIGITTNALYRGEHILELGEDGNLTFPDGSIQTTAYIGQEISPSVPRSDTAPVAANGQLWFNTLEGRMYIKYDGAWVDAAPLMTPAPELNPEFSTITFPDASVQTTAFTGISDKIVNGDYEVVLDEDGALNLPRRGVIRNLDGTHDVNIVGNGPNGFAQLQWTTEAGAAEANPNGTDELKHWVYVEEPGVFIETNVNGAGDAYEWHFKTDGTTQFPNGVIKAPPGDNTISMQSQNSKNFVTVSDGQVLISAENTTEYNWAFGTNGVLTLPSSSYLESSDNNLKVGAQGSVTIRSNAASGAGLKAWTFGTDGNLTLPTNTSAINYANGTSILDGLGGGSSYANANVANYLPTHTGNVSANYFIGNGSQLTGITATNASTAATVTTNAQPNITSVGTLSGLTVGPNSSIVLSGTAGYLKANSLQGHDGSQTIYLHYGEVGGAAGIATNLTVGTTGSGSLTANGTISASGNITGDYFIGNGSQLTGVTVSTATTAATVTTDAQPNITSVGTLSSLSVSGNITGGNLSTAGRVVSTGNIVTGGQIQSSAFTGGNISWSVNNQTDFQGAIKVGGTGVIKGPGGASSITLNNNGANIPIIGVTNTSNSTSTTTGALIVSGGAGIAGNVNVGGLVSATGTIDGGNLTTGGQVSATGNVTGANLITAGLLTVTGNITGGNIRSNGTVIASNIAGTITIGNTNSYMMGIGNVDNYVQSYVHNKSNTANASADMIVYGSAGTDNSGYMDMGMTSNNFSSSFFTVTGKSEGYLFMSGVAGTSGNMVLATGQDGTNNSIEFYVGGFNSPKGANRPLLVSNTGISVTGNITGNTNGFAIGYRDVPQVAASNATIGLTDAGKHFYSTTAGNFTLTIPNNATTTFSTGTAISIVVQAAGNILVNAASGVTLYMAGNSTAANRVVGAYGMATIMKVASDTWFINGTGVS